MRWFHHKFKLSRVGGEDSYESSDSKLAWNVMHTALWQLSCIFCLSSNCHAEYSCEFAFFWVSSLLGWTSRLFIVFMYVLDLFRMISKRLYLPWPWHISIIILASLQAAWAKASGRHNGHRTPKIWKYLKKKNWQVPVNFLQQVHPTHLALMISIKPANSTFCKLSVMWKRWREAPAQSCGWGFCRRNGHQHIKIKSRPVQY